MSRRIASTGVLAVAALLGACDGAPVPTEAADPSLAVRRAAATRTKVVRRTPNQVAVARSRTEARRATSWNGTGYAIISNGTVMLGVNAEGHLNVPSGRDGYPSLPSEPDGETFTVGLRFLPTRGEGTAPGCECEGWGAADAGTMVSGYANESSDGGPNNLEVVSFTKTDSTAISVVLIRDEATEAPVMRVTHTYRPARETRLLYRADVSIENVSDHILTDVRYRRVMDWDIPPNTFDEFVSIQGTAGARNVLMATSDGFRSADPLDALKGDYDDSDCTPDDRFGFCRLGDFIDHGYNDHGAHFDFGFGRLEPTQRVLFRIFYGGASTETQALGALSAVGGEVFSLGQSSWNGAGEFMREPYDFGQCTRLFITPVPNPEPAETCFGATTGGPNTFIFGFGAVGGERVDNLKPEAVAGGPYVSVPEGTPFNFNGSASNDPEGFSLAYDWRWGDGTPNSAGERPAHVYAQNGRYDVRVIVTDRGGLKDTATTSAVVTNVAPFLRAPEGRLHVDPGKLAFLTWPWEDRGRNDSPWRLTIDWGDGATSTGVVTTQAPIVTSHSWRRKGTYAVRLTIIDKDGGTGTTTANVVVK